MLRRSPPKSDGADDDIAAFKHTRLGVVRSGGHCAGAERLLLMTKQEAVSSTDTLHCNRLLFLTAVRCLRYKK
jgi:hypothetical protein